ncbi:Uroporphyrinogen-III synthase [Rhodovulum sp. P5]|nr:Uroporphyrinogen-III synthase [Rhodovulum sp. P5]
MLLTRPRMQSDRFARAFADRFGTGFQVVTAPIMEIALFDTPIPLTGVGGLVFTSENGVAGFAKVSDRRDLPAYCVGDRTAQAARMAGLTARSAAGTAEDLVTAIAADPPDGGLLHLRGEHARGDVSATLAAKGLAAMERVVYAQRALSLPEEVFAAVAQAPLTLLPLFSPRSAVLVSYQLAGRSGRLALVTMSPAVTEAWAGPEPIALHEAERPDAAAMMDGLGALIGGLTVP